MTGVVPPRMPRRFEPGDQVTVAGELGLFVVVAAPLDRTGNHMVRPASGGPPRVVRYAELAPARHGRARLTRSRGPVPGQLPLWPFGLGKPTRTA